MNNNNRADWLDHFAQQFSAADQGMLRGISAALRREAEGLASVPPSAASPPKSPDEIRREAIEEAARTADQCADAFEADRRGRTGKTNKTERDICTWKHDGARWAAHSIRSLLRKDDAS